MLKCAFLFTTFLLLASVALADVQVLYPVESNLNSSSTIQAGFVGPNQEFELIFSDNSGHGFEWNTLQVDESSLPSGWQVASISLTDASLIARIKVPRNAQPNFYVLKLFFSNDKNPSVMENVSVSVVVKQNLLDVSFARPSIESIPVVGENVSYKVVLSNSSIAPQNVSVSSSLPSNWFKPFEVEVKPNSVEEIDLLINPKSYGKHSFSFQVVSEEETIIKSYSAGLNVRPTLKGKFSAALSGFPFFTFNLLPFQLFNAFISLVIPV